MLKSRGGITRGRGITPSNQAKIIHALPKTIPVCSALEQYCNVMCTTNEQHIDMRETSSQRDTDNIKLFFNFIKNHSPFAYVGEHISSLVSIATGVVAYQSVNCEKAEELGRLSANSIEGQNFADVKLKRKDNVISLAASHNSFEVRGKEVQVNPTLLFLRITCVIKDNSEMKEYMKYEFSKLPTNLFKDNQMRSNTKSDLANIMKRLVQPCSAFGLAFPFYVLDGGYLVRHYIWPSGYRNMTYSDLCDSIILYLREWYSENIVIVFDGYRNPLSIKLAVQKRRGKKHMSADMLFSPEDKITCDQATFFSNLFNKARFIDILMNKLKTADIECYQSLDDADYMVVATAINKAVENPDYSVLLVGNDMDLLGMAIHHTKCRNIYMYYSNDKVYNILDLKNQLSPNIQKHILVLHAMSGCDTTSAMYSIGKTIAYDVLESMPDSDFLNVFTADDATHEEISEAGEEFILKLFHAKKSKSLDNLRYIRYMTKLAKKSITSTLFGLESLPPTSAAAKYQSYRVYLTVQQWLGVRLDACTWGWEKRDNILVPVPMGIPVAPDKILKMISCGCKTNCGKRCKCRKGDIKLYCTPMCSTCNGQTCTNIEPTSDE